MRLYMDFGRASNIWILHASGVLLAVPVDMNEGKAHNTSRKEQER